MKKVEMKEKALKWSQYKGKKKGINGFLKKDEERDAQHEPQREKKRKVRRKLLEVDWKEFLKL